MILSGRFRYVGGQCHQSKDGKDYYMVSLLQGLDSSKIYVDEQMYLDIYGKIPEFSEVDCDLRIDITPKGTYVHLEEIRPVGADAKSQLADKKEKEKKVG